MHTFWDIDNDMIDNDIIDNDMKENQFLASQHTNFSEFWILPYSPRWINNLLAAGTECWHGVSTGYIYYILYPEGQI